MKEQVKKLMALALALSMSLSLLSGNAWAQEVAQEQTASDIVTCANEENYSYDIENSTVCITGYFGSASNLTIPSELDGYPVTAIGEGAFYDCKNLTSVTIPDSVCSIGEGAFCYCKNLTSVSIGKNVSSIDWSAFASCDALKEITVAQGNDTYYSSGNAIIDKNSKTLIVGCQTTIIPLEVTAIGYGAFYHCSDLTSITIPNHVTLIDEWAFSSCTSLMNLNLPDSVTTIKSNAFSSCNSLTSVDFPDGVVTIGKDVFFGCSDLESVSIGSNASSISGGALSGCSNLQSITVAKDNATYYSSGNAIIEKDSKTLIAGCQATVIPEDVRSIGSYAFYDCLALTSIYIPNGVTSIEEKAFADCYYLANINIPTTVTYISGDAFDGTEWLDNQKQDFVTINGILYLYQGDSTSVTIPNNVVSIGDIVFSGCDSLKSISIPNSVVSIGYLAFYDCYSLTSVTIPQNVTSIGEYAFGYYDNGDGDAKVKGFTINGFSGSAAEKYATNNGFTFVCLDAPTKKNTITASNKTFTANASSAQTWSIDAKVLDKAKLTYKSDNKSITVDSKGKVTVKKGYVGKATISISAAKTAQYTAVTKKITVTVNKAQQPMTVSPTSKTYKVADVKKKAQSFTIKLSKAQGAVTYKSSNTKYVTVDKKGKVTLKKGTPKGKYTVTVTAAGKGIYNKGSKTVTITLK